jgi:hypothetical protein
MRCRPLEPPEFIMREIAALSNPCAWVFGALLKHMSIHAFLEIFMTIRLADDLEHLDFLHREFREPAKNSAAGGSSAYAQSPDRVPIHPELSNFVLEFTLFLRRNGLRISP